MCHHSTSERALIGTWTTIELYKALDLGYKILVVYEVYHYTDWMEYDGTNAESGFFTEYVNTFLKLKQQASGWPDWVETDEDKDHYIQAYEEHEGIKLDPSRIERNEAMRQMAKLCLNSFWGKFGQRNRMKQVKVCTDQAEYFSYFTKPDIEVQEVQFINDNMVQVTYIQDMDFVESLPNTNVVFASLTTAQARLKLYEYLEKLQDRVFYFDTGNSIFLTLHCF